MKTASTASIPFPRANAPRPRLGFIGLGWIGTNRLAAIARANVAEIVAIADPLEESLTGASEHAPDAARLSEPMQLLDLDLDGVVIATPSAQHADQCIMA